MDNKATYRQYLAALLKPDALAAMLAADFVAHDLPPPGGRDELVRFRRAVMGAFPDQSVEVMDILAEGDRVAARFRAEQTHAGAFHGLAPTGKRMSFEGYEIIQVAHGKVAARWAALKPSISEMVAELRGNS